MGPALEQNRLNNPSFGWHSSIISFAKAAALWLVVALGAAAQVNVTTFHMDNGRTGQNTSETILTPSNVNVSQFGKLFALGVDAPIYAQPLYVANVTIGGAAHNVVFVATENDSVYAFDADSNTGANATYLWKLSLGTPVSQSSLPCGGSGTFGVTSTPVIDTSTNTMYVVAFTEENGELVNRLHALDIRTGNEKSFSPVVIDATVSGTGDGSSNGQITFSKLLQFIRPGLLESQGTIYLASGALCEGDGPFHGWVFGYNASTLAQTSVFNTTPNGGLGGIWMSGAGLAADSSGNLFVATGNGSFDTTNIPATMFGDTFLKLSSTLTLLDYFTPWNQAAMDGVDNDLGSGGVLLIPTEGSNPDELVEAGKLGTIYVVDRDQMTTGNLHYCTTCTSIDTQILQELPGAVGGMWASPAYWNSNVYFWGQSDVLKQFSVTNGVVSSSPVFSNTVNIGGHGTTPTISSNGTANGILWALAVDDLHAYDATNVSNQFYDSGDAPNGRDTLGGILKFTTPIVANGKVYVGTTTEVDVFGLLSGAAPTAATPTFSPGAGTITSSQPITISDSTTGATIYYTTNGTTPTVTSSEQYTAPFTLSASATVQAIAAASGDQNSPVASAAYTVAAPAATPTLSPNGGTITTSQKITISDSTPGAVIYYTTNGTTPKATSSELYTQGFSLSASATVEALAVASGYANSSVSSTSFTVSPLAATPTISPNGGTITTSQQISISDTTSGHAIYYTTNGTAPTVTPSELYSGPFTLSASATVQAIAVASGFSNSAIASVAFTIQGTGGGSNINYASFTSSSGLSLNGAVITSANRLRLTDGGANEARSAFYTTPVNVQSFTNTFSFQLTNPNADGFTFTIQNSSANALGPAGGGLGYGWGSTGIPLSVAVKFDLYSNSGEGPDSTGMYTDGTPPTIPAVDMTSSGVNLHSGDIMNVQMTYNGTTLAWTVTDATTGATFTDSVAVNIPSTVGSSTAYVGFTAGTGGQSSTQEILSWTYSSGSGSEAATPTFSPAGGTIGPKQQITISDSTGGSTIYYTTNGTAPAITASEEYTAPFTLSASATVQAIAVASGFTNSATASATFTVAPPADTPIISPAGGTISPSQQISITDATSGAVMYYTTNGTDPSVTPSEQYSGPFTLSASATVEAIAISSGYSSSSIAVENYTVQQSAATPTFSEGTGTYSGTQSITLSDTTSGAVICYAINAVPTTSSTKYTAGMPIMVSSNETVEAMAVATGYTQSAVASATYTITSSSATINYASFTSSSGLTLNGAVITSANRLRLTDGGANEARSAFYTTPVNVQSFTNTFSFQLTNPNADGFTFTIQNSSANALGPAGGGLGYGWGSTGIPLSVAVKFDLYSNSGEGPDSTGMYTDGTSPTIPAVDMTSSGVNLHSGDIMNVQMTYNGTTLAWTITDATTGATFTDSAAVNIPSTVGSSTAYVGFTAGTGGQTSTQEILSWAYTSSVPTTINYASFASSSGLTLNGAVITSANRLRLTDGGATETRSAFYTTPVNVQSFTNTFSFQLTNPNADGFTFTIQNSGPTAVGPAGGGLGYGAAAPGNPLGIPVSVAVKFDLYNNDGEGSDSTGMYTDGASPTIPAVDMTSSGVNLHSGDIMNVQMTYNGTTLAWTITDATTGASFTDSVAVNIPSTVGGSTAYVGFTAGTGGQSSTQEILSWTFTSSDGPEL